MAKKTEEADTGKWHILGSAKTNTGQLIKSLSLQGEGMGGGGNRVRVEIWLDFFRL